MGSFWTKSIPILWRRIGEDDVLGLSAQLAYFFLLSLFPLLIFLVTLLSYLPITMNDLIGLIGDFIPAEAMAFIESNLKEIMGQRNGKLLSIAIIGTIWSASVGINAIVKAFNKAYDVKESRSLLISRVLSIVFTIAMMFVFILALLLHVFGKQIGLYLFTVFDMPFQFIDFWNIARWFISSIIIFSVFVVLYWIGPNIRFKCIHAIPGAIFSTIAWALVSLLFSYYVNNFANYSATYGSIGTVIVLMVWFYLSGIIIILGGEINSLYSKFKDDDCN